MGEVQSASDVFRRHRHDVLNELQLVRGYLQMGRQEEAVRVIDRTASWLQSLTYWQVIDSRFGEQLMWAASVCPNLQLSDIHLNSPSETVVESLVSWLHSANEVLETSGGRLSVSVHLSNNSGNIALTPRPDDALVSNWHDTYSNLRFS